MTGCEQIRAQMIFFLDDELHEPERADFEAHLQDCATCRSICEQEREFLSGIREARPLATAPQDLRLRVARMLDESPTSQTASPQLRGRILQAMNPPFPARALGINRRWLALATAAVILVTAAFWFSAKPRHEMIPVGPSEFALMAVETHLRHSRGQLPLEILSSSPQQISDWFTGKVSFSLKLPNYQESSGQEKLYHLEGARLVAFKNGYAAHIAYQMQRRLITLVVTSALVAEPSGGETFASKGLTFHYDSIDGLKVLTWKDRGLTYALVSDLEERGQRSCIVCHAGTKDSDLVESLGRNK